MKILSIFLIFVTFHDSLQPALMASTKPDSSQKNEWGYVSIVKSIRGNLTSEQNVLLCPINILTTLILLHLGASGETRNELSLFFYATESELRSGGLLYNIMSTALDDLQRTKTAQVKISNAIFVQRGTQLNNSYSQTAKKYFENEVQQVDFAKGGSEATDTINSWVSKKAKNRLTQSFKKQLPATTQLMATSVTFFNATWKQRFNKQDTEMENFDTGASQIRVPMMRQKAEILRAYSNNYEIIGIPFDRTSEYTMFFFLPSKNTINYDIFSPIEHEEDIRTLIKLNITDVVDYKLPRFRIGGLYSYRNHTMRAGVKRLFENAELGNMLRENTKKLRVSDVNYVAELQMNEDGIFTPRLGATKMSAEAAATSLRADSRSEDATFKFWANRPFSFSIYHTKYTSLFYGTIQNPLFEG